MITPLYICDKYKHSQQDWLVSSRSEGSVENTWRPYPYSLGNIGTVPMAYEGMEGEKKTKKWKIGKVIQIKYKTSKVLFFFFQKRKFHYKPTCEVGSVWEEHNSQSV
jgi:hypothetical protein